MDTSERSTGGKVMAFHPNGQQALLASVMGELRLLNLPFSGQLRRFDVGMPQFGLDISPDGRTIVAGTYAPVAMRSSAQWWNLETGEVALRVEGLASGVSDIGYSPDGRLVFIGSCDWFGGTGEIVNLLVDAYTGEVIHRLEGHQYGPRSHAFSPDSRLLLTGSFQWGPSWPVEGAGELFLWDAQTGELLRRFENERLVFGVDFSPDSSMAIVSHTQHHSAVTLWDVNTGKLIREFPYVPDTIFAMTGPVLWGPDATTVLVAGTDGLFILDITTGEIDRSFGGQQQVIVTAIDHTVDWRYLIGGDNSNPEQIVVWDYESGEVIRRYAGESAFVWEVVFSPDGQRFYTSSYTGPVLEWQVAAQPLDELLVWIAENRYVRDLTCAERSRYRVEPLCEAEG
jgi:WD40 repeat protein